MRKQILYIALVSILFFANCNRHCPDYSTGSGFDRTQIDSATLENLEVLGRVWGYVKYHHPIFADSAINIDYELFELLPKVADADRITRNRVLAEWIDGLGSFTINHERYDTLPPDHIGRQKIDLNWTQDTMRLGSALSNRLVQLRYADRTGNYYVTKTLYDRRYFKEHFPERKVPESYKPNEMPQACFRNESAYPKLVAPDYGYRLLAVFRFWNMVEYFFPSKYLIDRSWDEVLPEYISRMASLPDGNYIRTMWRMIAEIKDSHANWGATYQLFGYNRVPLNTAFVEGKLIVSTPDTVYRYTVGGQKFQVGDEIIAVNSRPISFYMDQVRTYIPCSNEARVRDLTADVILRANMNTQIPIRYRRNGIECDTLVNVQSGFQNNQPRDYGHYADLGSGIRYVNPGKYTSDDEAALTALCADAKGLIIDSRSYPTPDFNNFMGKYILPDSLTASFCACHTYPELSLPGVFRASRVPDTEWRRPCAGKFPIVVMVYGYTQSQAETIVQYLQARHDVTVVGNQTAGANGDISFIHLPGGIQTCFSGLGWYYNDGEEVQRQGVRIDYEVHPTIEGIKAGRDEVLEKAIAIIKKQ